MEAKKLGRNDTRPATRALAQYLDLEKAVDYLIDETPEGAPFRDDADLRRLSDQQRSDRWKKRRRRALPLIVRLCAEGRWKANGKKPGSAGREDIPDIHFIDSEIDRDTGDLMTTPGGGYLANPGGGFIGQGARLRGGKLRFKTGEWKPVDGPESKVAIWTELMFSVPGGADEGKGAELPGPAIVAGGASSVGQPSLKPEIAAGGSVEPPGHASTRKPWTQARTDYWVNRATEIRRKSPRLSLLQIAQNIEKEDAPDHLPDDQKNVWKKKGWTTENIHRRLKGRL